jgi:CRP-like cAMP-binding protein
MRLGAHDFLATIGQGRTRSVCAKDGVIYAQGDDANEIFYLQKGSVRLSVVSHAGKEATIGLVSEGSFFGEASLASQTHRSGWAVAMTECELLRIDRKLMLDALQRERSLSDLFLAFLLARTIRSEEDLVDQLFNSSEKRLARLLLLLARFGQDGVPATEIPKISQQTMADMIGTTRSRVSFFMNRFRKLGFIDYSGRENSSTLQIHRSLLNVVLHDSDSEPPARPHS